MNEDVAKAVPSITGSNYDMVCPTCGSVYNACASTWCDCITDSPTLVCPHCGHCFCSAAADVRRKFWAGAPPSLWERRLHTLSKERGEPPLDSGNPIRRPLVLVADDDPDTRRIAFRLLDSLRYGVLLAQDGESALKLAKMHNPDLILTDQMMPHMDGKHLSKCVKSDEDTRGITVIVMSGLFKKDSQRIEILRDYGADDFLMKPVSFDRLKEVLESWLAPPTSS